MRRLFQPVTRFGANHSQRRTLMWIISAISVLVIAYGAYMYFDGRRDYNKFDEERKQISLNVEQGRYYDPMMLVAKDKLLKEAQRRRDSSILYIGLGFIGLGIAYFVAPEGRKQAAVLGDDVPSFVADQISSDSDHDR